MAVSLHADVLIVGAGPGGTTAATALGRSGARVVLADRCAFPREKVCGDALIPDALTALERLGLRTRILRLARRLAGVRIYAPSQRCVTIASECASAPTGVRR